MEQMVEFKNLYRTYERAKRNVALLQNCMIIHPHTREMQGVLLAAIIRHRGVERRTFRKLRRYIYGVPHE